MLQQTNKRETIMKIHFLGVPPTISSGYGCSAKHISTIFDDLNIEHYFQSIIPNLAMGEYNNKKVYPAWTKPHDYGNEFVREIYNREKPDLVISLMDTFTMKPEIFKDINLAAYQVVDSIPYTRSCYPMLEVTNTKLTFSKFSHNQLNKDGIENTYIPLPIDPIYEYQDQSKAKIQLEKFFKCKFEKDSKIINIVGANVGTESENRKDFATMLRAYKYIQEVYPNTWLILHTEIMGREAGWNIAEFMYLNNIPTERILVCDQFMYRTHQIDSSYLKMIYSASDINLNNSRSGALELTTIESSACGCIPVAPTAHCTLDHVIDFHGIGIQGNLYPHQKSTTWHYSTVEEVCKAIDKAFSMKDSKQDRMERAKAAQSQYSLDIVQQYWENFLC